ncbi:MAG TPA: response regulator [Bryobacteraceae bacterium]|nr:response regulator [Bryobacteraceae bacterium]
MIVEDNDADVFLIQEALAGTGLRIELEILLDGEQAIDFFERVEHDPDLSCPTLIILDINLPKKQGGEVLKQIRRGPKCSAAPVLVVSTSDSQPDRERMASLGADGYFRKPSEYEEFMKLGAIAKKWLGPQSS